MTFTLDRPLATLNPVATTTHAEGDELRRHGPLVPVALPGDVRAWAATDPGSASTVFEYHPDLSHDPRHWGALQRGELPAGWPLLALITSDSMLNLDGPDHQRLRRLVAAAFTPRRVADLRPQIEALAHQLLDTIEALPAEQPVDLKELFAFPLPMASISTLFGVTDHGRQAVLRSHYTTMLSSHATNAERHAAHEGARGELLAQVAQARTHPGPDLTSALISARDAHDRLTEDELVDALELLLLAGHETTVNAITNTVHALLTHTDQLKLLLDGTIDWAAATEAGLRWNAPLRGVFFRYAIRDTEIAGVPVRAGEPVLIALAAANRATLPGGRFDLAASQAPHLAFGAGPHTCIGSHLARLETTAALQTLFARFPRLTLATGEDELIPPLASPAINGLLSLPVLTRP